MNKTKLIIHERFNGKQSLEDVFLSASQSESCQLLQDNSSVIMNSTEESKNILNDMYAKDLSRKVKAAKRQRAYKGLFISAQTPYGYKIDPMDKKHLVVDEEVADVVKKIFRFVLGGKSLVQISRILIESRILTPGPYKAMNGDTRFERYLKDGKVSFSWCYQTVRAILKHRGIRLRHRPKKHEFQNIFQKLTFCVECGHHMTMMKKPLKSGTYPLIRFTNHFQNPEECTHHHQIYYEDLYAEILKRVQGIAKQIESGEMLKRIQKQKKYQK